MRVKKVKYGKRTHKNDGYDEPTPKTLTVEMSLAEATYISKMLGQQNWFDGEKVFNGGGVLNSEIYTCLNGEFFNKHFFCGDDDAVKLVQDRA